MSTPHDEGTLLANSCAATKPSDGRQREQYSTVSDGMIARFLDFTTVRHGFDRSRYATQRDLLFSLDLWMLRSKGLSIVNTSASDLQRYFEQFFVDAPSDGRATAVGILREFFSHLRAIGFRHDDPGRHLHTEGICESTLEAVA